MEGDGGSVSEFIITRQIVPEGLDSGFRRNERKKAQRLTP